MLTWLGINIKGLTIRNTAIEYHRFILPFYEEWMKEMYSKGIQSQLKSEKDYVISKINDDWFAIYNSEKNGYLLIDNRTREISFTRKPRLFIDTRIPISDVPEAIAGFGYAMEKTGHKDEILECSIKDAIEYLEANNEE
ncbi:MAG: hypothetical protein A2017_17495 [Lentisphaerae bacterium GWF2_44_16]|nr:MAG: hypothetical protein A2017_17495 [Lentisphaerae bacterium GWF2_44_16]HAU65892.1 hypothetical protein [Candidatus Uhrbacteria bacterium]